MKQGHTLDFEDERIRDFIFELLTAQDRRLGRSEVLDMAVPDRGDVLALMEEYEADQKRIEDLERDAEELHSELDDVILRDVYELDKDDIEVIEAFLETW